MEITDYRNKLILAPMVRCGTLAFRLLALEYGADIVYSEEIIDFKMMYAKRRVNEITNTIDFCVDGIAKPVFQTNSKEQGKVVFQLGTCDPQRALQVCKLIENDVAAIDINMGCPKEFSVQGGMGSALLKKPNLVKEILTSLVNGCSKPITCKIRCLPSLEDTINLCKIIEGCGVKAIGIHGRLQHERSKDPNRNDYIKAIAEQLTIPVIANGGSNVIKNYEDIETFKQQCGASSVMLARVALWNCSIFRKEGTLPLDTVVKRFLKICLETANYFFNTKFVIQHMLREELQAERGTAVLASLSGEEIYKLFGMLDEYNQNVKSESEKFSKEISIMKRKTEEFKQINDSDKCNFDNTDESVNKKIKQEDHETEKPVICMNARYHKKDFKDGSITPKSILHTWTLENEIPKPLYITEEKRPERVYRSRVEINNVQYTVPHWETSKQFAEQSAAIVCLEILGIEYRAKVKR